MIFLPNTKRVPDTGEPQQHYTLLLVLLVLLVLLPSCRAEEPATLIHLSHLEPVPLAEAGGVMPLRVAVAAIISPQGTVDSYTELLDYLESRLGRPVELVQRRTYGEVNDLLASGDVDVAFVCTSAYVAGTRDFGMQLLVAPRVTGRMVYHSLLIVPAESTARGMADLRGSVFAFTDPISTTGRNYPLFLVHEMGVTGASFFERTFYTYSHDDAIRAVAQGVADGAAVDNLVYEFAVAREPELGEQTRVIHTSPPFGMPPVVTGPHTRPQLAAEVQALLLEMEDNPEGRAALASAGFDGFGLVDDASYDTVRSLAAMVTE
jgi:phosphonate transport system substrate-binding protein